MSDYRLDTKCVQAGYTSGQWRTASDSDRAVYHV